MPLCKGSEGRGVTERRQVTELLPGKLRGEREAAPSPRQVQEEEIKRASKSEDVKIDSGMLAVFNFILPLVSRIARLTQTGVNRQTGKYN